jgi:hypothetical protein
MTRKRERKGDIEKGDIENVQLIMTDEGRLRAQAGYTTEECIEIDMRQRGR